MVLVDSVVLVNSVVLVALVDSVIRSAVRISEKSAGDGFTIDF